MRYRNQTLLVALGLVLAAGAPVHAVTITKTKNTDYNHAFSQTTGIGTSPYFTTSSDGAVAFDATPEGWAPSAPAQAGAVTSVTSIGTFNFVGNSTSAGVDLTPGTSDDWLNGNGVPTGITLSFNAQVTVSISASSPAGSLLTLAGTAAADLGNGLGITQTPGATSVIDAGESLDFSAITVSNVNFSGTLSEPGFTFAPGTVSPFAARILRSSGFTEAGEGAILTSAAGTVGFGLESGSIAGNQVIDNNFMAANAFPAQEGPFQFGVTTGMMALKGINFVYDVTYDISPVATAENADFNGDTAVDGADFLVWQQNVGVTSGGLRSQGNANPDVDGAIDATDLGIWQSQYGTTQPAAAAVPEPATLLLALLGGVAFWARANVGTRDRR
jgi:hypothetical protein